MMPLTSDETSAEWPAREQWHPAVLRFYEHWESIHPPCGLPGRRHFDPAAVPELLPWVWMLDVYREPLRFRYRLVGTEVVDCHRKELTGLWLDEAHPHLRDDPVFFERYRRVVVTGKPSWRRGQPRMNMDHEYRIVENVVLPLADDGKTIDVVICLSRFHLTDDEKPCVAGLPRLSDPEDIPDLTRILHSAGK